jgi:aminoglycoside phosphotransferase (APT) family kinase protein
MATEHTQTPADAAASEARLRAHVEKVTGGRIVKMERQPRWRPAWFVEVERDGKILPIYLRGDRKSDILPFPELRREADVMSVLHEHGIPVPYIYGVCDDPSTIVMESIGGTRDVSKAASDAERHDVMRQYIKAVAAMHKVPLAPFAAKGIRVPTTAEDIALAGLHAYFPLYQKNKKKPEPLIEFSLKWIRNNVPKHRTRPSFIQFDSGQYLFKDGRMTGLYDFEFSMIGDPMVDLATMRMRQSYEPYGVELKDMVRQYEIESGEPVDHAVINFHTLQFSTVSTMQIAGTVAVPQPGDPHATYLEWDLALRRQLLTAMKECMGIEIQAEEAPLSNVAPNAALIGMVSDALAHIEVSTDMQRAQKTAAEHLVECLIRADGMGGVLLRRNLDDVSALLGRRYEEWAEAEAALEKFVLQAGPEMDAPLLRFFTAQHERRMMIYGPTNIGGSARHVYLSPTR